MADKFDPVQFEVGLALARWQQHSNQRLGLFTAYVAGVVSLATVVDAPVSARAWAVLAVTVVFWLLDRRTRELVKHDEAVLTAIEAEYVEEKRFRVLERDDRCSVETSYSRIFNGTFGIAFIGAAAVVVLDRLGWL